MTRLSIARETSVCSAPGCLKIVYPGTKITRTGRGAWRHADCASAGRWFGRKSAGIERLPSPGLTVSRDGWAPIAARR